MNENEKPLQGKKLTRPEGVNVIYDEIPYIIDELFNEQAMEDFLQSQKKNFGGMDKKLFRLKERETVQMPLLEDLRGLGWTIIHLKAHKQKPQESRRASFDEVFMREELHASLLRLNPWLLPTQADTVIKQLTEAIPKGGLVQDNKEVLNFLLNGMPIKANTGQTATQYPTVKIIDFEDTTKNSFIACAEFKVRIKGTDQHIVPDIVLFVNGLPLVVIECKSIKQNDSIGEGIEQLLRYSEQRGTKEGSRELFKYNQFVVVTNGFDARFGSISSHEEEYFFKWTDPYPYSLNDLPQGASLPSEQTRLVYGMCSHANLLDILKTFVIFRENDKGETFKVVGRYQQFRAVKKTVERLLVGKTKIEKGGIVWHTQGSGKSLTMHFLVREMYHYDELKDYKIVFITDRTDLENQLGQDISKLGSVRIAENTSQLREYLTQKDSSVVMGMIQKFQEKDLEVVFPELNTSPKILVMIDEAHRTQYQRLGANLDKALPNAVRIAFTGTPIEKTKQTFGDYIDKYTMRQAVEDKVTLRIVYEGRTAEVEIKDKDAANRRFRDVFSNYDDEQKMQILGTTRLAYLNSEVLIAEKAKDMVQHYIANIFDNGFKAQIVACSREATVTYKTYVDIALKEKIKEIEKKAPKNPHLPRLRKLRAEVIISSAGVNDKLTAYTDATKHAEYIASFKRPFDSPKGGEVGILIVTSMLLVGFDAPVEQVLYLDKVIREHTLLQTIARVNRIASNKDVGYIVDYVGVANHLKDALSNYSEEELKEAGLDKGLQEIDALLRELKESSVAMQDFFAKNGIENLNDIQAMYDMFYDEDIRFTFVLLFKKFTSLLNQLYPKKEALAFMQEMEQYSTINALAYQYSRDKRMSMRGIPEKLRLVIDAFLLTKGINIKVEPIEILDDKFTQEIAKYQDLKTKTEAIQHATRTYIEDNTETDPELYASFAEELEAILIEFQNNWEELYKRLEELRKKMKYHEQTEPAYGLNRKTQMPFFRTLKQEFFPNKEPNEDQISVLVKLTQDIYYICKGEQVNVDYWENIMKQSATKRKLQEKLIAYKKHLPIDIKKIETLNSRLMEKAKKHHDAIQYALD